MPGLGSPMPSVVASPLVLASWSLLSTPLEVPLEAGVAALATYVLTRPIIEMLLRTIGPVSNYRRRPVAFPAGVLLLAGAVIGPVSTVALEAISASVASVLSHDTTISPAQLSRFAAYLATVLGFGLVGFIDDILGDHGRSGFGGHLGALASGEMTTGVLKIILGATISLGAVVALGTRGLMIILDAVLVALSANMLNLLDRRPGRAVKGFLLGLALVTILVSISSGGIHELGRVLHPAAAAAGAALVYARLDLKEQAMLGDTGSNVLGAALGFAVLGMAPGWRVVALALLAWLTGVSEETSFSDAIDRSRLLRFIDQLGREREK